jgi:hypothetical protein
MRSYIDYSESRCTQGSFRLLVMSMIVVSMMITFFPNRLDPLDRILSNLLDELT